MDSSGFTISTNAVGQAFRLRIKTVLDVALAAAPDEGDAFLCCRLKAPFVNETLARAGFTLISINLA